MMHVIRFSIIGLLWNHSLSSAQWVSNGAFISHSNLDIHYTNKLRADDFSLYAGFAKTLNDKKRGPVLELSPEAKKYLQKHNNNVDAASAEYFQSQLQKIPKASTDDGSNQEGKSNGEDLLTHESKVAAAWNTIALFLPQDYARTKGKVETHVDRRLRYISSAIIQTPRILESMLSSNVPSILDIGCGDGSLVPYLKSATIANMDDTTLSLDNYYGLDISSEMISLARQRWRGIVSSNQFISGSFPRQAQTLIQELRIKDSTQVPGFGAIVFNGSLQFFQDTSKILKEAVDLLQPGGRIILSHVNGSDFVKDECKKNPGIAVRSMPNNISLDIMAHDLGLKILRKRDMNLKDYNESLDGDDGKFYLVVLEKYV
jgi:SAM-dependent methyltransferase